MGDKETSIVSSRAAVYKHNPDKHAWESADSGLSRVDVYVNSTTSAYRVIGMDTRSKDFTMNTMLFPTLNYQKASDIFHQWTDSQKDSWGLNFASIEEADAFSTTVASCVAKLDEASRKPQQQLSRPPVPLAVAATPAKEAQPAPSPSPAPAPASAPTGPRAFAKGPGPATPAPSNPNPGPVPFSQRVKGGAPPSAQPDPAGRASGVSVVSRPGPGLGASTPSTDPVPPAGTEESSYGEEPPRPTPAPAPAPTPAPAATPAAVNAAITNELFARLQKRADMNNNAAASPAPAPAPSPSPSPAPSKMKESNPPSKVQFGPTPDPEPTTEGSGAPLSPFGNKRASAGYSRSQVEKKKEPAPEPQAPTQPSNPQISAQSTTVAPAPSDGEKELGKNKRSSDGPSLENVVTKEDLEQFKRELFAYIDDAKRDIVAQIVSQLSGNFNG